MNQFIKSVGILFLLGAEVITEPKISEAHAVVSSRACNMPHTHVDKIHWHIKMPQAIPDLEADASREADILKVKIELTQNYLSMPQYKLKSLVGDVAEAISSSAAKEEKACGGMPNKNDHLQIEMHISFPISYPSSSVEAFNRQPGPL